MDTVAYFSLPKLPSPQKRKSVFSRLWVRFLKLYEFLVDDGRDHLVSALGLFPTIACLAISITWSMRGVPDAAFFWGVAAFVLTLPFFAFQIFRATDILPPSDIVEARYEFSKDTVLNHEITVLTSRFKKMDADVANHVRGLDGLYESIARRNRAWLNEMLRVFSFKHSGTHPKSVFAYATEVDESGDDEALALIKEMKEEYRGALGEFEDLVRIWNGAPELATLCLHVDEYSTEEIEQIGEELGIEPMVEAYYSGVPLDDIVA